MASVNNWGSAVQTAFANAFGVLLEGIPKIVGFLFILIVGWIIASIIAKVVTGVLHAVRFNQLAERSGFAGFVKDMGVNGDSSSFLAGVVKWFIRLIVLVAAFDALGLPAVSDVLQRFLLWIPNLVVALVVLVIGGLLAQGLSRIVRGATAEAGLGNPDLLAKVAGVAVWAFAIIVAVNQIGIATTLINTLFIGFVGAVALAVGLAFGLGGRETAARIVQNWYRQSQNAAPKMAQAAQNAGQQANGSMSSMSADSDGTGRPGATSVVTEQRPRS